MHPLDFIEKFSALASGAFSSWPSISTNVIVIFILFFAHDLITTIYATLEGMNNLIINIISLFAALTLYGGIYRIVAISFRLLSQFCLYRRSQKELLRRQQTIRQNILKLSRKEIAILKFLFHQDDYSAWLPDKNASVMLLERKNILLNVDFTRTKIVDFWHGSNRNLSCNLYQITYDALKLLNEMHGELYTKWRNVKTNNTFADFQKP